MSPGDGAVAGAADYVDIGRALGTDYFVSPYACTLSNPSASSSGAASAASSGT